jgi:hypothetical protein
MIIFDLFKFRDPSWMLMSDDGGDGGNDSYSGGGGGGGGYDSGHYGGSYGGYGGNTYSGVSGNYGGNYGISYGGADRTDPGTDLSDPTGGNQSPSGLSDGSVQGQEQAARDAAAANDPSNEFAGGVTDTGTGPQDTGPTEGGNFPGADTGGAEQTAPSAQTPSAQQGQGSQSFSDYMRSILGGAFSTPANAAERIMPQRPGQGPSVQETIVSPWDQDALPIAPYPGQNNPFNYNPNQPGVQFAGNPNANIAAIAQGVDPNAINPTTLVANQRQTDPAINPVAPGKTDRLAVAADATPMDTLNQLLGPGEASVPTITPDQFGFNPFAPQPQVADANVPLPRADPRTQIGDATFDRSQFPFGPGGAPSTQQGRQVASLNDPFRDPPQPAPLGPDDPLPEGGTVSNPITPRGSYSSLSDISTGGYAQNRGNMPSWVSSLAQQAAMQQPAPAPAPAPPPAAPAPPPGGYGPVPDAGGYVSGDYGPVVYPNTPPAPASGDSNDLFDLGPAP